MKKISGVYCITNKVDGKKYFGQSVNVLNRKRDHSYKLRKNIHKNEYLQYSFNKYGEENFEFKIIKVCKPKYLDRFEKLYIRAYNTIDRKYGYNLENGGNRLKTLSDETKRKISIKNTGKNNGMYGKTHNYLARKRISQANKGENNYFFGVYGENHPRYGLKHTEETKKKISKSKLGQNCGEKNFWYNKGHLLSGLKNPNSKYSLWDSSKTYYSKKDMYLNNTCFNPRKCFKLKWKSKQVSIGGFVDFYTPELLNEIIKKEEILYGSKKKKTN